MGFTPQEVAACHVSFRNTGSLESSPRNHYADVGRFPGEVGDNQKDVFPLITQECKLSVGIKTGLAQIGIHEIEEATLTQGIPFIAKCQNFLIDIAEPFLMRRHQLIVAFTPVHPPSDSRERPIVENRRSVVISGESFTIASGLAQFLTIINKERSARNHGGSDKGRNHPQGIARIGL